MVTVVTIINDTDGEGDDILVSVRSPAHPCVYPALRTGERLATVLGDGDEIIVTKVAG